MQYDLNLTPNGGQQIDAVGHFIKYKIGIGPIRVKTNTGAQVDLMPGQGIRASKPFGSITVTDRSGNSNMGILIAGDYEFQDDSIAGAVSIIDGGKSSTLAGNCFIGTVQSGTTSYYGFVSLGNPDGSGKNLVLESVTYSAEVAGPVYMSLGNSRGAFATVINDSTYSGNYINSQRTTNKANTKNSGVQGNVALLRGMYMTTNLFLSPFFRARALVGTPFTMKLAEPIIIQPGNELCIFTNTSNEVGATIEWREDGI
jgi:hypothetical protein